jgi:hypothetical protein
MRLTHRDRPDLQTQLDRVQRPDSSMLLAVPHKPSLTLGRAPTSDRAGVPVDGRTISRVTSRHAGVSRVTTPLPPLGEPHRHRLPVRRQVLRVRQGDDVVGDLAQRLLVVLDEMHST